jgi:hypothetical protein
LALLVPDVGENDLLKAMFGQVAETFRLHLYKNNHVPAEADVVGSYTECNAAGYASIALVAANFVIATVAGVTTATYAIQTFTFTATESVYGYYVTNNGGTILLWAEMTDNPPYNYGASGGTCSVTLSISLD